ncbi:MAG: hypothetical protein GXP30_03010, partial [Verrucomicrobia bacterium]|nr:hypothetical protein [Verrucomicrobiota bacterium]
MSEPENPKSTDEEVGKSDANESSELLPLPLDEFVDVELDLDEVSGATDSESSETESAALLASAAGILRVWCPNCEQEVNILREHLGIQGPCPSCELLIVASMR